MNDEANLPALAGELHLAIAGYDLRPVAESDAADILAHFADPAVTEFLDIDPLEDLDEALGTIRWAQELRAGGRGVRWAIREAASGAFIGTCGFNTLIFQRGRRGEVAYDLSAQWWGRGVMAALMPALIEFGFEALALRRLEAMVTPGNQRSCRLLRRHGFTLEGRLADYGFWKGRYWDQLVFGLTRHAPVPTLEADQTAGRSPRS